MSLGAVITVVESGSWVAKRAYDFGYWMMWGTPKTKEEEIAEQLNRMGESINEIKQNQQNTRATDLSPSMFITPEN